MAYDNSLPARLLRWITSPAGFIIEFFLVMLITWGLGLCFFDLYTRVLP